MKKWTKKDIKALCSQIDTFWLAHRDTVSASGNERMRESVIEHLSVVKTRTDVVLAGLRSMRELHASRYNQECQTIGNALVRDIYGVARDEFVERFIKLARETDADHAAYEALVLRVNDEGLPDEVIAYDPTKR